MLKILIFSGILMICYILISLLVIAIIIESYKKTSITKTPSPSKSFDNNTNNKCAVNQKELNNKYNKSIPAPPVTQTYIKNKNTISRTDNHTISNEEIPYLIQLSYKQIQEEQKQSNNPVFHRTERDEELAFQFERKHGHKSDQICNTFLNIYETVQKTNDIDKKILLLSETISAFEKAKKWHYSYSKGAMIHFQDYWECLHNSKNSCFSWVDNIEDEKQWEIHKRDVLNPWILKSAQTGFMQPKIYSAFPNDNKSLLRATINELVENGSIKKEKKGSSYFITLNHLISQ